MERPGWEFMPRLDDPELFTLVQRKRPPLVSAVAATERAAGLGKGMAWATPLSPRLLAPRLSLIHI